MKFDLILHYFSISHFFLVILCRSALRQSYYLSNAECNRTEKYLRLCSFLNFKKKMKIISSERNQFLDSLINCFMIQTEMCFLLLLLSVRRISVLSKSFANFWFMQVLPCFSINSANKKRIKSSFCSTTAHQVDRCSNVIYHILSQNVFDCLVTLTQFNSLSVLPESQLLWDCVSLSSFY